MGKLLFEEITGAIIGSAFEVHKHLGYGFLESVYKRAMQVELLERRHKCVTEHQMIVRFKNTVVGNFSADLLVDELVLVELKVAKQLNPLEEPQLLNELVATGKKVGLPINFGKERVEFKRMVN
ncbi:GxxExxY protein [Adhaeretor mobilis]|uniref:GxxExxY protein n=1 Tax=Adhaeretor mobilis TaxID=1930276 RepID=A0A517MVP4_9BACT|nr:GxxExxY protein [Adhaeretor mobilis]QDS98956.1 hypothetical protein HG15A2_22440 [Adhaeretor mobilis]